MLVLSIQEQNTQNVERVIENAELPSPEPNEQQTTSKKTKVPKKDKKRKSGEPTAEEEEGEETEEDGGKRKPTKPRSWTWDHFTKYNCPKSRKRRARCKWCEATYACDTHRNGTSNLKNHLLTQCKKFPRETTNDAQTILSLLQLKKEDGKGVGNTLVGVSFDVEACREALSRMIIIDELPFKFVEGEGFRYFMSVVQPRFTIPGRITVARDCWNLYVNEKNKLKSLLSHPNQSVCLTTDCWSSVQNLNYLCLTAHFIDNDWKLNKRILNFCLIKNHKGETIGRKIEKCLLGWGISKVFSLTVDNASGNDVAVSYLKGRMEDWNAHPMKGEYLHVRCCAHILNLVVNDGLNSKDLHASINKIRNVVRFVRASPGRLERFKNVIKECRIQDNSTVQLDVSTRWNSTYLMLVSALKFQKAFKRLGERDTEFALMSGGIPKTEDWDNARVFVEFLKIFYDVTLKVSGSLFVTSSQYFHEYCLISNTLKKWSNSSDPLLETMAEKMKAKHDKYWGNIKNTNMMIFIAVVLDPRYKLRFVAWSLQKLYDKEDADLLSGKVKETFEKMFIAYRSFNGNGESQPTNIEIETSETEVANESSFASEFDKDVSMNEIMTKNEVEEYLLEPLEKRTGTFDILNWWKVNSSKYPILGLIAKDVLAMPVSTVASESAFSTGGRILNNYRSSLTPKTVEALICAQDWFRSSPLATDIEELVAEFEKIELGTLLY